MRVLLTSHHFPPDFVAGVERITQAVAAELTKGGDEVSIVTRRLEPGTEPRTIRERLADGTLVYRLAGGARAVDRFLLHHERLEELFQEAMVEAAPDVVHVLHLLGHSPRSLEIARRHGAAVVVSLQDFYFACPLYLLRKPSGELCEGPQGGRECARTCFEEEPDAELRWGLRAAYFRRLLGLAERVICPSRYVARYFERYGVDASRVRVIANAVSIPSVAPSENGRPTPRSRGRLNVAYLGSVVRHKGVHLILEALGAARLESDLIVFGGLDDPSYAQELREQAKSVPTVNLRLYGAYDTASLPLLLRDIDCVVAPSQWPEAFAIVAREALMQGVPPIVSRVGGLQDAVVDGKNGFTFNPDKPGELAFLFQRLVYDESLLPRLREEARKTPVLTIREHVRAVRTVYEEAVEGFAKDGGLTPADLDELAFLHSALIEAGFAGTRSTEELRA